MKSVSGLMYAYSCLCQRKLWFYTKDIMMEQENENVRIGKIIDEESYKRDKKHIYLDNLVCIDIVRDNVVCEVKKSSAQKEMAIQQLKYYLYLLQEKNIQATGQLLIPKENIKEIVQLSEEDKNNIEKKIEDIYNVCNTSTPPQAIHDKICKKCAYFELCYI